MWVSKPHLDGAVSCSFNYDKQYASYLAITRGSSVPATKADAARWNIKPPGECSLPGFGATQLCQQGDELLKSE
jgi:hypothetical protein